MIGFGLLLTGALFLYTMLHAAPFRSLTAAIEAGYPGSSPRVEGGKPRLDEPGEMTLRITMRVPFDPADEARAAAFADEIATFTADHHDLQRFEVVEIHLFQEHPEQYVSQRSFHRNVADLTTRKRNP